MSKHLERAQTIESLRDRLTGASSYLDGPRLAAEIQSAVRAAAPRLRTAKGLSSEGEAVAAMVGERVARSRARERQTHGPLTLRQSAEQSQRTREDGRAAARLALAEPLRQRHGAAADVLAHIARGERELERGQSERVERGQIGRHYIGQIVAGLLRDSREWRDVASEYQTARERQTASGSMVVAAADCPDEWLAQSDRSEPRPLAADLTAVAAAMVAAHASERNATDRGRMRVALIAGLPGESGEYSRGPQIASELALSYGSVRNMISAGGKLWRATFPDSADLIAAAREQAEQLGLTLRARGEQPDLSDSDRAAREAVETVAARTRPVQSHASSRRIGPMLGGQAGSYGPTGCKLSPPVAQPYCGYWQRQTD